MIGIDKLKLYTNDFYLKNRHEFIIQNSLKQGQVPKVIAKTDEGTSVSASKMFCNDGHLGKYTINDFGLIIEYNPNKLFHNYKNAGCASIPATLSSIRNELNGKGVVVGDINESTIGRIDICRQHSMKYRFANYKSLFALLNMKRGDKIEHRNTYRFGNKNQQFCFYDLGQKILELESESIPEPNLMRCELRLLKKRSVTSFLGTNRLNDFLELSDGKILDLFNAKIGNSLFSAPLASNQVDKLQVDCIDNMLAMASDRGGFIKWVASFGVTSALAAAGGWDNIKSELLKSGFDARQVLRHKKMIDSLMTYQENVDRYTIKDLYSEVYTKFAA